MNTICPDCLDEYEFSHFEVDADTLEHYGMFKCSCDVPILFPEILTREILGNDDLLDQIRISRLMHLNRSFSGGGPITVKEINDVFMVESRHLKRYIQDFSEQSVRLFK